MKSFSYVLVSWLLLLSASKGNTNFVSALEVNWQGHNASNVLAFVEAELTTNQNAEVYFVRGIVATYLQEWGVGATNYFRLASESAETDSRYSAEYRAMVLQAIVQAGVGIEAIMEMAGGDGGSPSWNTNTHAVIFNEFAQEIPFKATIELLGLPPE
jgi:hypothetical protein